MKNKIAIYVLTSLTMLLTGCGAADAIEQTSVSDNTTYEVIAQDDKHITDNHLLYENQDPTYVETMYLTVSSGAESDGANHTWEEINTYSVYDYDAMGVDRYKVNGLLQVGDEDGPSAGQLGYGDITPNATVCIRGQTSSRYARKNYRIELREGKGTYKDTRVINLNKHMMDKARFTNKMCYDLISEMPDMISMRTQFVHLYVKDTTPGGDGQFHDYGIYTQVEQPNKSFLKAHGLDSNGHLYKINSFEFFRYEDVIRLNTDPLYDEKAFEQRLEIKGDDDHTKLIAMLEDVNNSAIPIEDVVDTWFEEDNLLSWMAFQILIGNIDTQSRNTLIYSPQNVNTWYFISWDCDDAFTRAGEEIEQGFDPLSWEYGISNYWGNVLFNRILKEEVYRQKLDEKMQSFLEIMTEEKLDKMQRTYASVMKQYLYKNPDVTYAPLTESSYDTYCGLLKYEPQRNYELFQDSLEKSMPFFIGTPYEENGAIVFEWDSSYTFDREKVKYTIELAKDYGFADPILCEKDTMACGYTYSGSLEPGQYFIRVIATNEVGKTQSAFDYYVTADSQKIFGVKSFFVLEDGSIVEDIYEE